MASNILLNGSTYSGTPASGTLYKPVSIEETIGKIGVVVEAEAGNRTLVQRAVKRVWALKWEKVPESTRAALATLAALASTFAYVDEHGTSYTVQIEPGDYKSSTAFTDRSSTIYYNIDLTLHEA